MWFPQKALSRKYFLAYNLYKFGFVNEVIWEIMVLLLSNLPKTVFRELTMRKESSSLFPELVVSIVCTFSLDGRWNGLFREKSHWHKIKWFRLFTLSTEMFYLVHLVGWNVLSCSPYLLKCSILMYLLFVNQWLIKAIWTKRNLWFLIVLSYLPYPFCPAPISRNIFG